MKLTYAGKFWVSYVILLTVGVFVSTAHAEQFVGFSHSSPSAKDVVLKAVNDSKKSLRVAAYQYTNPDILQAIIAAKNRGVDVQIILDQSQSNGKNQANVVKAGIPCYIDHTYKIMHHKFTVVDDMSIENGSFNYSVSADKANAENALYTTDAPKLADAYTKEFNRLVALPRTTKCSGVSP